MRQRTHLRHFRVCSLKPICFSPLVTGSMHCTGVIELQTPIASNTYHRCLSEYILLTCPWTPCVHKAQPTPSASSPLQRDAASGYSWKTPVRWSGLMPCLKEHVAVSAELPLLFSRGKHWVPQILHPIWSPFGHHRKHTWMEPHDLQANVMTPRLFTR